MNVHVTTALLRARLRKPHPTGTAYTQACARHNAHSSFYSSDIKFSLIEPKLQHFLNEYRGDFTVLVTMVTAQLFIYFNSFLPALISTALRSLTAKVRT
jgi:hypothetical protein